MLRAVKKGLCSLDMIEVIDVDQTLELAVKYGADVPVLLIDGVVKMKHVINQAELEEVLPMLPKESVKC